jgi:serine/threonine-protein kinase
MDTKQWQQVEKVLNKALDLDSRERTSFLKNVGENNPEIYRRVTELLDAIDEAEDTLFLEQGLSENEALFSDINKEKHSKSNTQRLIGTDIGSFTLTEFLGSGGMAVVYKGERQDGSFNQTVAIKILNKNFYSEESMLRFRAEQQILSRLNHPHIAYLIDGGVTDEGNPYLIMEYVKGEPITDYCSRKHIASGECLSLFKDLCQALNYAHKNLIVHRDLKPQNILVTEEGNVKVLDFGIAKLLDPASSGQSTLHTQTGVKLLSPSYCAPEQLGQGPITTSTDVFTLGLLLYELATGKKAVDGQDKTLTEIQSIISEANFTKPSLVNTEVDTELDAIIRKALRKEPDYRYDSAGQMLEDLRRYEKSLPLIAKSDTLQYRGRKFMSRNRNVLMGVLVFLIAVIALGTYHVSQISKQRDKARMESKKAQTTLNFLVGIFEQADPHLQSKRNITAREILDDGTNYIQREMKDQPEIRASILDAVGNIYRHLGIYEKAEPLLYEALNIRRNISMQENAELASSIQSLASYQMDTGSYDRAAKHFEESASIFKALNRKSDYAKSVEELGWISYMQGNYKRANSLMNAAMHIKENIYGYETKEVARTYQYLAWNQNDRGYYNTADSLFRKALAIRKKVLDQNHPLIAQTHNSLGRVLYNKGDYAMAEEQIRKSLKIRRHIFDENHPDIAQSLKLLGLVEVKKKNYEKAELLLSRALEIFIKKYGEDDKNTLNTENDLATVYFYRQNYPRAADMFKKVAASNQKTLRPNHPELATSFNNLALTLQMAGNKKEALAFFQQSLDVANKNYPEGHPKIIHFRSNIAKLYEEMEQYENASEYWLKNYQILKNKNDISSSETQETLKHLVASYKKSGNSKQAQKFKNQLLDADPQ